MRLGGCRRHPRARGRGGRLRLCDWQVGPRQADSTRSGRKAGRRRPPAARPWGWELPRAAPPPSVQGQADHPERGVGGEGGPTAVPAGHSPSLASVGEPTGKPTRETHLQPCSQIWGGPSVLHTCAADPTYTFSQHAFTELWFCRIFTGDQLQSAKERVLERTQHGVSLTGGVGKHRPGRGRALQMQGAVRRSSV